MLQRIDRAWSRDGCVPHYVQDAVTAQADAIRAWLAEGAAIYVCGSLQGMAGSVHAALAGITGEDALQAMTEDGRYRRDVY
ncbi:Sulfite reductase [NADPH] flavoprotein alpha-component [compost metagenome]